MNGTGHAESRVEHLMHVEDAVGAATEAAIRDAFGDDPDQLLDQLPGNLSIEINVELLEDIDA